MLERGRVQSDLEGWNAFCLLNVQIASQRPKLLAHIHMHTYTHMDLYKLPLHKTHVIIIRMAAWTASRSLEGKYVVFGGGGDSGALRYMEGSSAEPKVMGGRWKWRSRHKTKEREGGWWGVGAAGRMEGKAGKLICLGDGMSRRREGKGVTGWGKGEGKVKMTALE